jgi:hypothetical protein
MLCFCPHTYSFGIVMYEIAARKLPFVDEYWMRFQRNGYFQARDCINAIIHDDCRPTPPGPDHCPPEFAQLMLVPTAHRAPLRSGWLTSCGLDESHQANAAAPLPLDLGAHRTAGIPIRAIGPRLRRSSIASASRYPKPSPRRERPARRSTSERGHKTSQRARKQRRRGCGGC